MLFSCFAPVNQRIKSDMAQLLSSEVLTFSFNLRKSGPFLCNILGENLVANPLQSTASRHQQPLLSCVVIFCQACTSTIFTSILLLFAFSLVFSKCMINWIEVGWLIWPVKTLNCLDIKTVKKCVFPAALFPQTLLKLKVCTLISTTCREPIQRKTYHCLNSSLLHVNLDCVWRFTGITTAEFCLSYWPWRCLYKKCEFL